MQLLQFLYTPIVATALTLSGSANSIMNNYDLIKITSIDGKKIVLKELGALDHTLFTRSGLRPSSTIALPMLISCS